MRTEIERAEVISGSHNPSHGLSVALTVGHYVFRWHRYLARNQRSGGRHVYWAVFLNDLRSQVSPTSS